MISESTTTKAAGLGDVGGSIMGGAGVLTDRPSFWLRKDVIWASRILLVVLIGLLWEYASGRWIRQFYLSKPTLIGERVWEWLVTGDLWHHLAVTLQETLLGFLFGALAGFVAGLALGRSVFLAEVVGPILVAINSMPKVALAPLLILWFGIGLLMKVILAVIIVFFLVFYNTFTGVRDVDVDLVNIVKTMGASRLQILTKIVIPSALLWVFTGLRISIPYALIGAVVGEIFASNRGIGYLIQTSGSQFDTAGVFGGLIVLTIVSTLLSGALTFVEKRLFRWRAAMQNTG